MKLMKIIMILLFPLAVWADATQNRYHTDTFYPQQSHKVVLATLDKMESGDRACYLHLRDQKGNSFEEMALFSLCEADDLIGKELYLVYKVEHILDAACEGDPQCQNVKEVLVVNKAYPLRRELFTCKSLDDEIVLDWQGDAFKLRINDKSYMIATRDASGGATPFAGGGASWIQLHHDNEMITLYSGIGKWGENGALITKQGLVIHKDFKVKKVFTCNATSHSSIGPDFFESISLTPSSEDFDISQFL